MHPEISVENYSVDNNAFFRTIAGQFSTGFHRKSLGDLKRFLVFYSPPPFFRMRYLYVPDGQPSQGTVGAQWPFVGRTGLCGGAAGGSVHGAGALHAAEGLDHECADVEGARTRV
mgnify:CR=1 FL=1